MRKFVLRLYHGTFKAIMATFRICIYKHQRRADEKYPVSIRVCWKRQYGYIKTEFYVTDKQINKKTFALKDSFIIRELDRRIAKYEELKSQKLGLRIELYTAKELAEYFEKQTTPGSDSSIDFIAFARKHCERLRNEGRVSTAQTLETATNAIIDFCNGREKIAITEITSKFLGQFEKHLRSERTIKRKNQFGKTVTTKKKPLSDVGVFDYMTNVRILFNAAINEFNDDEKDEVLIAHYPFRKYKLQKPPEPEKRNLKIEQIKAIAKISETELELGRTIFARDVFMLSFYLVGINMADLYDMQVSDYRDGRLSYKRRKTKGRRRDQAFISIKVEPEAVPLIEKYRAKSGEYLFDFSKRYCDSHTFGNNVNKGLKKLAGKCGFEVNLTTYYARHSWATIARNNCGVSKDDINLSLNHVDEGLKMADVYIAKDWSLIDEANRKVIDYLYGGDLKDLKNTI